MNFTGMKSGWKFHPLAVETYPHQDGIYRVSYSILFGWPDLSPFTEEEIYFYHLCNNFVVCHYWHKLIYANAIIRRNNFPFSNIILVQDPKIMSLMAPFQSAYKNKAKAQQGNPRMGTERCLRKGQADKQVHHHQRLKGQHLHQRKDGQPLSCVQDCRHGHRLARRTGCPWLHVLSAHLL